LNEEKEADRILNDLAENTINSEALAASGEEAKTKVRRTGAKTRTAGG